jgi:hypothetical protein
MKLTTALYTNKNVTLRVFGEKTVKRFVIGHDILAGNYLTKCHDLLISQLLMYVGDRQSLGIKMATSHKIQT